MLWFMVGLVFVFAGCMVNNLALEHIVRLDRSAGSFVTLAQVLLISMEGLLAHLTIRTATNSQQQPVKQGEKKNEEEKEDEKKKKKKKNDSSKDDQDHNAPSRVPCILRVGLKPRAAPLLSEEDKPWYLSWRTYGFAAFVQFIVSVLTNEVFRFHIQMPIHMVFRSSSPVTNLLLGYLIFRKRYDSLQISAAVLISAGVCFATLASLAGFRAEAEQSGTSWPEFLMGLGLLAVTTALGSLMGCIQEAVFTKYGKAEREMVFYSHVLSLPLFLSRFPQMVDTLSSWSDSAHYLDFFGLQVHALYFWLLVNVLTQYMCIHGVFLILARTDILTLSLILALRKFGSLLLSVYLFDNPFTTYHQIATALVFTGSLVYSFRTQILAFFASSKQQLSTAASKDTKDEQQQKQKHKTKQE